MFFFLIPHDAFLFRVSKDPAVANLLFLRLLSMHTANGNDTGMWIHAMDCNETISTLIKGNDREKEKKRGSGSLRVSSLTYLAVISIFVIDSCMKTIGVHDRVFDVNDKVENSLEPAG